MSSNNTKKRPSPSPSEDNAEKKQCSDNSNISHSSWIHKLTSTPNDEQDRLIEENVESQENDQANSSNSNSDNNQHPHNVNGLWSWLGYSGTQRPPKSVPESNETEPNHAENDVAVTPQESQHSATTYKQSYWKSFFISNKQTEGQDSVIVEDQDNLSAVSNNNEEETPIRKTPIAPSRHNVVLPTFRSQFSEASTSTSDQSNNSLFSKAINAINSVIFASKPAITDDWQDVNHLSTLLAALKADIHNKRIVIIGVHGWFPMKLVRSMVGEPTGTSIKFCEQMTTAVKKYFKETHELDIPDESIVSIPLQWEGKVMERVEKLYSIIESEYRQAIEEADVILWTTHSQGTPVSAILLRKLIEENFIKVKRQPVCMLAMAGISHGPFPSLKGSLLVKYFEADAARELFDFMDSNSDISIHYRESMDYILQNDVKTVLVGSMQDQVVPLYSAIMSGISHPSILRAIYIDGHIYTKNDFLIRLITFALHLLNVGLTDHGFLIHISEVLAGNIYAWEGGHSTVYEELDVFMLPLQYLFEAKPIGSLELLKPTSLIAKQLNETTDKAKQKVLDKVKARLDPFQAKLRLNPFHLPWAMRGIWDDPRILDDESLSGELDALQDLFDKWNPTSSRLKEIKFRLEPLKARL